MRRTLALVGLMAVVAAGVLLVEHANGERKYARLLRTGQTALDSGSSYAAIEAFSGAIALRPSSMVAYYHRGEAYRAQHRDEEAIRDFHAAIRLAPDSPQPLIALGDLYETSDPAQAASWYGQAAAQLKSADPGLLYKLALARYRSGFPAGAIDPLRQAIARNDSLAEAHYLLGLVYRDTLHDEDAVAALERAVRLAPNLTAAREELADLYRARGRSLDEMNQLQVLSTMDNAPSREIAIGLAQSRDGQFPAALGTLTDAARKSPADSQVQLAIARVYLSRAERSDDRTAVTHALQVLEQALGGSARRSEGLALYGRALSLSGDHEGAERILREAVATSPVDPEAFAYLADAAENLSHFSDARDALLTLDVLEGDTASAERRAARAVRLGTLSLRSTDYAAAVDYLSQAIAGGKRDAATLGLLARARYGRGNRNGAVAALDEALNLEPRNPELLRLRRTIK